MIFNPHDYQTRGISFVMTHPKSALFLEMGLGKTATTLTAIQRMQDAFEIGPVLVIAPKSVAQNTWTDERDTWDHLSHIRTSVVLGTADQRSRALEAPADIYIINRENTEWICEYYGGDLSQKFDMIVLDESSSFKNHSAKRFKALKKASGNVERMVLLTGTPSPNGYEDLWAQYALLDGGQRLGRTWTSYLRMYFHPLFGNGHVTYKYGLNSGAADEIVKRVSDITLTMKAEDYIELPEAITIDKRLSFSPEQRKQYDEFKRDFILNLGDNVTIDTETAVALAGKLHQFTSGAVYDSEHMVYETNRVKVDALSELVETAIDGGESVLIFYQYQHELPRLQEALKAYKPEWFNGQPELLKKWNEGKAKVLLAHPASVSYGLNMQRGGHIIVWTSLTYNLEQYQQANARLHRQGQKIPVRIYRLVVNGTIDETIAAALSGKRDLQEALLQELKKAIQP